MGVSRDAGKAVLITGASSGLGRQFAKTLAGDGLRVVVAARRIELLSELVKEIRADGGEAMAVAMDVQSEPSVIAAYDAAQAAFGPLEGVIANAGLNAEGLAADMAIDDFDRVMSVNVRGAFLTAREGARRMMAAGSRESRRGRIILIASIGARKVLPGATAYCASKAAVTMMGQGLAREWANRGINVNVICPGYIRTDINADWFDSDGGKKQLAGFPRRRLMDVGDMDDMVRFLIGESSKSVTGSVFTLDDGQTL